MKLTSIKPSRNTCKNNKRDSSNKNFRSNNFKSNNCNSSNSNSNSYVQQANLHLSLKRKLNLSSLALVINHNNNLLLL
ncbi:hypothetical protein NW754_011177 [Fusarium falciforme]|nr:hypothetical protein NW754_011177 [Fusarium falciforme]